MVLAAQMTFFKYIYNIQKLVARGEANANRLLYHKHLFCFHDFILTY